MARYEIERRRQRVIAPRWWAVASVTRGFLSPVLDLASARAARVHEIVREAVAGEPVRGGSAGHS